VFHGFNPYPSTIAFKEFLWYSTVSHLMQSEASWKRRNHPRAKWTGSDMTQIKLAQASGVGVSTVTDFELGSRQVSPMMVNEIAEALERAGIEFSRDSVSLRRRSAG
jgi:helix-turn-helix protein